MQRGLTTIGKLNPLEQFGEAKAITKQGYQLRQSVTLILILKKEIARNNCFDERLMLEMSAFKLFTVANLRHQLS